MPSGLKVPLILKENRVPRKTNIPRKTLQQIFNNNVVELKFTRRVKPNPDRAKRTTGHLKDTRRMLCTSNWRLISSPMTRRLFLWKKPKKRRGKMWYFQRKLMIVWDLMYREFRMISLDDYYIIGFTPVSTLMDKAKFIAFFRQNLKNLPKNRKKAFADK